MRLGNNKHLATIANTGGGKGRSAGISNLLTHEGSAVSVEIGGATYKATSNFRRIGLKQKVFLLDPLGTTGDETACFNVLDILDKNKLTFLMMPTAGW